MKIRITNLLLLFMSFMFIANYSLAQESLITTTIQIEEIDNSEWISYFENEQIEIYYKYEECDPKYGFDNQSILFKLTNLSDEKFDVSWQMHKYYDGKCNSCNYPEEYLYKVSLGEGMTKTGSCAVESAYQLKIFSKFIDVNYTKGKQLTSFKFDNLQILEISKP